jgi:hypothetical protein
MKTFTQYLSESKKEYAFRILFSAKPAADIKDHIKKTLAGYSVKRVGEIKTKLPAREHPLFTGIENPEIFTCDVVCDYPATAEMIRKSITDFAIDKANVAVETLEHAESVAAEEKSIAENTSDTALLMQEYKADKHKVQIFTDLHIMTS